MIKKINRPAALILMCNHRIIACLLVFQLNWALCSSMCACTLFFILQLGMLKPGKFESWVPNWISLPVPTRVVAICCMAAELRLDGQVDFTTWFQCQMSHCSYQSMPPIAILPLCYTPSSCLDVTRASVIRAVPNMDFQYSAEYRIVHCSIRPNMNTNSCWCEKENERKYTELYFRHLHTLQNISTIHYDDFPSFTFT